MGNLFRVLFLVGSAVGGVIGAMKLVTMAMERAGAGHELEMSQGGVFVMIPVGVIGALVGAMLGGMLLPRRR